MEKFIKLNGRTYFQSELELMSTNQLKDLIEECQQGIEDISYKKDDYKKNNTEPQNSEHFWEVINKFEAASVYLQSDIILINKIIKSRKPENDPNVWYQEFYNIVSKNTVVWKKSKFVKMTNEAVGFELQ